MSAITHDGYRLPLHIVQVKCTKSVWPCPPRIEISLQLLFLKVWEVRFTSMFCACILSYKWFPVDPLKGWEGGSPKPHMLLSQRRCSANTCWHTIHAQEVLVLQHAGRPVPVGLQTLGPESLTARTTLFCSLSLKWGVVQDALHGLLFLYYLLEGNCITGAIIKMRKS